jgi:hypothetical protein
MPQIFAANNLSIQLDDNSWSLYNGRAYATEPIVAASPDGLTYQAAFASARRLPNGQLPSKDIAMVVVGWAVEDSSWHLGVLVSPEIAQTRGGRWCGLARWGEHEGPEAERAGQALATMLNKPLRLVPPVQQSAQPVAALDSTGVVTAPEAPAHPVELPQVPLMPLPISLGEWILQEDLQGLLWNRAQSWRRRMTIYAVLSIALAVIFGLLSLGARLSPYAPVQPDWLPLVGLVIAFIMLLIGVSQILTLLRSTSVLIDNRQRLVRVLRRSRRTILQSPYEGIEYALVSHVITRREGSSKSKTDLIDYDRIWPEVWVHLYSPRRGFIPICYVSLVEGRMRSGLTVEERRPLHLAEIDTPAHHAAMHMAEMIGVPTFVEER